MITAPDDVSPGCGTSISFPLEVKDAQERSIPSIIVVFGGKGEDLL